MHRNTSDNTTKIPHISNKQKELEKKKERVSRYISLLLRHKPEAAGIILDEHGWASVTALLAATKITMKELEDIVATDQKQRYSFDETKTKIRANQGHSIKVDLGLEAKEPPSVLYHGTATRFLDTILSEGLKKGTRNHVHLSRDTETARKVGKRHGTVVILEIDTKAMHEAGYVFYLSENKVWLTERVPAVYIKEILETQTL